MKFVDFIRLQNREMVENANIAFKLFLPADAGGKWFFYCPEGDTVEDLCKWVEDSCINVDITWPDNSFTIEVNGEDRRGNPIYKYVFDLTDCQ